MYSGQGPVLKGVPVSVTHITLMTSLSFAEKETQVQQAQSSPQVPMAGGRAWPGTLPLTSVLPWKAGIGGGRRAPEDFSKLPAVPPLTETPSMKPPGVGMGLPLT